MISEYLPKKIQLKCVMYVDMYYEPTNLHSKVRKHQYHCYFVLKLNDVLNFIKYKNLIIIYHVTEAWRGLQT